MIIEVDPFSTNFDSRFKLFHKLMSRKVNEILLVSTPYDAWVMEEDCRLSERIINEYRGLNLSHPPILTWVPTAEAALAALRERRFDMVITMPRLADMDALTLGKRIKEKVPHLPVILLAHAEVLSEHYYSGQQTPQGIDRVFVWSGNTDLLVAMIKSVEDRMNVARDTEVAGIRVILFVEDSPAYISSLLPILYKEVVRQTQAVMQEGLNEEHRLLTMRARPKILVAESFEEAEQLFNQFQPYILGVISDVHFSVGGRCSHDAGVRFLTKVKQERFDIPLLLASKASANLEIARKISAAFVNKRSPTLHAEVGAFFRDHLGFGDFVFRNPDGSEIARAHNLRTLAQNLQTIPADALTLHCRRNDFSRWLFARTEPVLATTLRPLSEADFDDIETHRQYLFEAIQGRRRERQQGIVANLDPANFDPETEFFKIGKGSLGGKARGLAFVAAMLRRNPTFQERFKDVRLFVPQTLVITSEGFESFVEQNDLRSLARGDLSDKETANAFLRGCFPDWIAEQLRGYLEKIDYPLAIRSSSLLEDAQFRAYAGLYRTYMISNDDPDLENRLAHLIEAIKLVYASTYFQAPKAFSRRVGHRTEEEQMAVIIQQMVGERYGKNFYPAISGVAHSHNYYPFDRMKPEDGIVTIALGLGKTVVEGEKTLRFSPRYPQLLPQRSTVRDILENSQRFFYSLKMEGSCPSLSINDSHHLARREIMDAADELPIRMLASTYLPEEDRIRDTTQMHGYRVLTFSSVLKYHQFPLAEILREAMAMGAKGMGCPVELEFSVNLNESSKHWPQFAFLQLRPMTARAELDKVEIASDELEHAVCYSTRALGNTTQRDMADVVYIKPDRFDPARNTQIAREIGRINATLVKDERKYLLIGPGRWGSADSWLGVPVTWRDISGVGAIVETESERLRVEPSQGSHFFHNITSLGISYMTVTAKGKDFIDWKRLQSLPQIQQSDYVVHVRLDKPMTLKVDGRQSHGLIIF
jgi:CheY-like chemotaxis protein